MVEHADRDDVTVLAQSQLARFVVDIQRLDRASPDTLDVEFGRIRVGRFKVRRDPTDKDATRFLTRQNPDCVIKLVDFVDSRFYKKIDLGFSEIC